MSQISVTTTLTPAGWLVVASVSLALLLLVLLLLLWSRRVRPGADSRRTLPPATLPAGVNLSAQPILSETEAAFYNVLRLTVQDEYLVFAQVPLWCLVEVLGEPKERQTLLGQMAFKRVDFVLVHPGNLTVAKVIELEDEAPPSAQRQARNAFIESILKAAEVEILRLPAKDQYTIPSLSKLLDIEEPE